MPLINQTENFLITLGNILGTTVGDFKTLIADLNQAMSQANVTDGFIEMPTSLQAKFISVVGSLANSMNTTANDFAALSANIAKIESSVFETNPNNLIPSGIFFTCVRNIINTATDTFQKIANNVITIEDSFTDLGNKKEGDNVLIRKKNLFFIAIILIILY